MSRKLSVASKGEPSCELEMAKEIKELRRYNVGRVESQSKEAIVGFCLIDLYA